MEVDDIYLFIYRRNIISDVKVAGDPSHNLQITVDYLIYQLQAPFIRKNVFSALFHCETFTCCM